MSEEPATRRRFRLVDERHRLFHTVSLDGLSEEDDVGFDETGALETIRNLEEGAVTAREVGVAVGRDGGGDGEPRGIRRHETLLKLVAGGEVSAIQASHPIEPPVEIDDPPSPRLLVETVDVLGDEVMEAAGLLQGRERPMRPPGPGVAHQGKARHRSGPVAPPGALVPHELLVA